MTKTIIIVLVIIFFAVLVVAFSKNKTANKNSLSPSPTLTITNDSAVPLPTSEDIIRAFFNLINEKRIPEAIGMLHSSQVSNDSTKQQWGVNFNSLLSVTAREIEPHSRAAWTDTSEIYKVLLNVQVKPEAASAPIPNYGWDNGENIRWVTIEKEASLWKISAIATGP